MSSPRRTIRKRIKNLEAHLKHENPILIRVVRSFRTLDRVAYGMGALRRDESYATQIPWWPLVSVVGTFSSGKSTFINSYLGAKLQRTGNQAVDDRFTVISYSSEENAHALPGVALDADPRFPFYQISHDIEQVAAGEGQRIDAYLQLKTCTSEKLRGKILIDSPGFDADAQRTSTLRIIDYIINLSDLVLVFFDARHPEPGAMQDTLQHLVGNTIDRSDSGKFLYILNQIDTTAREDNPEDVVAAWQRALAEKGLTAGRFFCIYDPAAAVPIEEPTTRERFEQKRDADLADIHERIRQVEVERAYRIVGSLEASAKDIADRVMPELKSYLQRWRTRVLWGDAVIAALVAGILGTWSVKAGYWQGMKFAPPWLESLAQQPVLMYVIALVVAALAGVVHFSMRRTARRKVLRIINAVPADPHQWGSLALAFQKSTRFWRSIFQRHPAGWGRGAQRRIERVIAETDLYVQILNDQFTNPSGNGEKPQPSSPAVTAPVKEATAEQEETVEKEEKAAEKEKSGEPAAATPA